ncbi:tetratricopeptide repeat protein [Erythrobacter rubeus]|uniref:Tetratricopeptide repeat protein n=1 Tax=Erythrobacter rubeus TaxID=2760803 RepID=A0ABR8KQG4_9SPHN|nr:tetratricopeptide repeat protein [Erythrobacter rubeus]MBD2841755.1 tetratricopeptide repeat protein [Erythrobacter rubeus]
MTLFNMRKRSSNLALTVALATGSAVVATAVYPAEAQAQRKKKDKEEDGGGYSDEFIAAYQPVNEALQEEGADAAPYKTQLEALIPLSNTNDEKIAAGGLIFNSGIKLSDRPLQLQGMELMLASGKVPAEQVGRYNFIAYQLSNAMQDFPKARTYLQGAIDNNFTTADISEADLQIAMAENFFAAGQNVEGLAFLDQAIEARKGQGLDVPEQWYRRGLTVAYNEEIVPQVYDFATLWIAEFPSPDNWRDAINLTRNLNSYEAAQMLDLLRLSRTVNALKDKQDYIYYVESADPRRLPKEVKDVIEEAYAKDAVSRDDIFVADALTTADGRIATDRADLPALESDADAAGAQLRTVTAAANAFYSYGDYAKAAKFYEKALTMPGVESAEVLTRLGMAQVGLGQYDAARTTLSKVEGLRAPIAQLWIAYANQMSAPSASTGESVTEVADATS